MAPKGGRGGGGGGRGGGGIKGCSASAFEDHDRVTYMVYYVLFTVVVISILTTASSIRKKHPHAKRIIGGTYTTALLFTLLGHLLCWIAIVVKECKADMKVETYLGLLIAYGIFWWIGEILLLVVFVWGLNTALRQRLGGRHQTLFQTISWVVLGIVAVIGATHIAISSYRTWSQKEGAFFDEDDLVNDGPRLSLSYRALFLVGSLIGGTLAILSLSQLRRQAPVTGPIVWVIILTLSLVIYAAIILSIAATRMQEVYITTNTALALEFVDWFFFHFACITLLFIAKSPTFVQQAGVYPPATYEQPAYAAPQYAAVPQHNGTNPPQTYYNQQHPVQLPNNQPAYSGQPQLDGTQRHEVKA